MSLIPWTDELQTGIKLIDEQHQAIINSINILAENIQQKSDVEALSDLLFDVLEHAMNNFIAEEEMFQSYGYAESQQHKSDNDAFNIKAQSMIQELGANNTLSDDTFEYLKTWARNHILFNDKQYVSFLKEKGVA